MCLQLLLVFINGRKRGSWRLCQESAYVILGVKPGVDAYRIIVSGDERHEDDLINPSTEMILAKAIEMVGETLPALLLQTYAFIESDRESMSPVVSIGVSVLSVAYCSAMISYDMDVRPFMRSCNPAFCGYIPSRNSSRAIAFGCMVGLSAFHVLLKVIGVALLASLHARYLAYLGGEMAAYLVYKALRRDFRLPRPQEEAASRIVAFIHRPIAKLLTDFTALIHNRNSFDLGGLCWTCSLIFGQIVTFVAAFLYTRAHSLGLDDDHGDFDPIDPSLLWTVLAALEASFVIVFAVFLFVIERRYVSTFFTTMTGPEYACHTFLIATTDVERHFILTYHHSYYSSVKGEIRVWLSTNWNKWTVDEKPDWFTPHFLASIPEDMLPKDISRSTLELRRKSIEDVAAGGSAAVALDDVRRFSLQLEQGGGGKD